MSQTIKVINRGGGCYFFTRIKLVARVLACACAIARTKWIKQLRCLHASIIIKTPSLGELATNTKKAPSISKALFFFSFLWGY